MNLFSLNYRKQISLLVALIIFSFAFAQEQSTSDKITSLFNFPEKSVAAIEKQYAKLEKQLQKQNERILRRMQKQEERLRKKLAKKDSLAAAQLFASSTAKYQQLQNQIQQPVGKLNQSPLREYIPGLDSVNTALQFLQQKAPNLNTSQLTQLQGANEQVQALQARLQQAADIKAFLNERKQLLKDKFQQLGLSKELMAINKQAYYYNQQIQEYKQILNDKEKLKEKLLAVVRELPAFKDFMKKNSYLARLFPNANTDVQPGSLAGLQTRAQVQQLLQDRFGSAASPAANGGGGGQDYVQQQMQQAQNQLNQLRDRVNQAGGGTGDLDMPDFKPNTQKTKTLLQRLEYGINIQSQQSSRFLPAASDIAVTVGYKLNDKSTVGVGGSYKVGWGQPLKTIKVSSQGASLRSFLDVKLKGSFWITGGYEYNYQSGLENTMTTPPPGTNPEEVKAWQKSGLIGLTKKYKVGKQGGNVQLLWDFLSYSQVPKTPALRFRVGYTF